MDNSNQKNLTSGYQAKEHWQFDEGNRKAFDFGGCVESFSQTYCQEQIQFTTLNLDGFVWIDKNIGNRKYTDGNNNIGATYFLIILLLQYQTIDEVYLCSKTLGALVFWLLEETDDQKVVSLNPCTTC